MWVGKNTPTINPLKVGDNLVTLSDKMKALGVYFQGNLCWDAQGQHAIQKSNKVVTAFRFLRKYMTEKQFITAASANYYGSVFYCCSVWFHSSKQSIKKKLNSSHFRLLRTAKRDFKMTLKRNELTELCERATPEQWTRFITATRVIKVLRDKKPPDLLRRL